MKAKKETLPCRRFSARAATRLPFAACGLILPLASARGEAPATPAPGKPAAGKPEELKPATIPRPAAPLEKLRVTSTLAVLSSLDNAINMFSMEHGTLPPGPKPATPAAKDTAIILAGPEAAKLIGAITGTDRTVNKAGIKFIDPARGAVPARDAGKGGPLVAEGKVTAFIDGWGSDLVIFLDADGDGDLTFTWGGKQRLAKGLASIVFSKGPDGKEGTADDINSSDSLAADPY